MKRTIEKIVSYAASVANADRIILFGSMADERRNVYSDVDLLIISERSEAKPEVAARVESFASQLSLKIDVLLHTSAEIEEARQTPGSFLEAIVKSGRVVYEKSACIRGIE